MNERLIILIPKQLRKQLKRQAKLEDLKTSQLVRRAIRNELAKTEGK